MSLWNRNRVEDMIAKDRLAAESCQMNIRVNRYYKQKMDEFKDVVSRREYDDLPTQVLRDIKASGYVAIIHHALRLFLVANSLDEYLK